VLTSNDPNDIELIGTICMCLRCKNQIGKRQRPSYSMCGDMNCDFGYPEYDDNIGKENVELTITELLAIAQVRPYVPLVKGCGKWL